MKTERPIRGSKSGQGLTLNIQLCPISKVKRGLEVTGRHTTGQIFCTKACVCLSGGASRQSKSCHLEASQIQDNLWLKTLMRRPGRDTWIKHRVGVYRTLKTGISNTWSQRLMRPHIRRSQLVSWFKCTKIKVVPVRAMKTRRVSRGTAPLILNLVYNKRVKSANV